jgi:hypothetical protein
MKKTNYLLIAVACIVSSCKKNDSGSGTTADTYLPTTVGSNWTYKMVTAGGTPTTGTFTVSTKDTSANNRTYKVVNGSTGSNQYYSKNAGDYYTLRAVGTSALELLILKDNLDVNGNWNTSQVLSGLTGLPAGITSVTVNTNYKIEIKGGSRVVNNTTYTNVIKVRADLIAAVPIAGNLNFGYCEFYFSKNIGIIESNIQIANTTAGVNINELYTLQSYTIK